MVPTMQSLELSKAGRIPTHNFFGSQDLTRFQSGRAFNCHARVSVTHISPWHDTVTSANAAMSD